MRIGAFPLVRPVFGLPLMIYVFFSEQRKEPQNEEEKMDKQRRRLRVHHERPIAHDRLVQRQTCHNDDACARGGRCSTDAPALAGDCQIASHALFLVIANAANLFRAMR